MNAVVLALKEPIDASRERIAARLDKALSAYREMATSFCEEWEEHKAISEKALSKTPADAIKAAVTTFDDSVFPVLRDLALRLYVEHGKWDQADALRRINESHRCRIVERIVPLLQSGIVVELNQFYAIQVQLSHIDDHDGEAILGHAMTAFGVFMGNPISMARAGSKVLNVFTGNTPKENAKTKLLLDRDILLENIEIRINELRQLILGLISSWLSEELVVEIQVSNRLFNLEAENRKLKKGIRGPLVPQAKYKTTRKPSTPWTTILIIALIIILTGATVAGVVILATHSTP